MVNENLLIDVSTINYCFTINIYGHWLIVINHYLVCISIYITISSWFKLNIGHIDVNVK
jgi:hypothetical protein